MEDDADLGALFRMPGHLIRRLQQIAVGIFMDEVEGFDITPVQYAILMAVAANPGIDATRVSALVAFDRSTLGDVLDRIEGKGWIERRPALHDKRVKSLWLSPAGHALYSQVEPAVSRTQERILAPLPEAERAGCVLLLRQLVGLHTGEERYA